MSGSFMTINPATGATIATYQYITDAEAAKAVANCHIAFRNWRTRSLEDRGAILRKIGSRRPFAKRTAQDKQEPLFQSNPF